eukprot:Opistho-2@95461
MEFGFNVNKILPRAITRVDGPGMSSAVKALANLPSTRLSEAWQPHEQLRTVIDGMGMASARAQGLKGAVTTAGKLECSKHALYLLKDADANNGNGAVLGLLKIGKKSLFVIDPNNNHKEIAPTCVLDFYVHESRQRTGCGHSLFEAMLEEEHVRASEIAYDRPSRKFLAFLRKHYGLFEFRPQANNFVVFDQFFLESAGRTVSRGKDNNFHATSRSASPGDSQKKLALTAADENSPYYSPGRRKFDGQHRTASDLLAWDAPVLEPRPRVNPPANVGRRAPARPVFLSSPFAITEVPPSSGVREGSRLGLLSSSGSGQQHVRSGSAQASEKGPYWYMQEEEQEEAKKPFGRKNILMEECFGIHSRSTPSRTTSGHPMRNATSANSPFAPQPRSRVSSAGRMGFSEKM